MALDRHPDIVVTGAVSEADKWDIVRDAQVAVSPSALESFSLVVLEAWVDRVPVMVNGRCDPTREHCARSGGGLWFTSFREFEAVLARLANDAALRVNGRPWPGLCRAPLSVARAHRPLCHLPGFSGGPGAPAKERARFPSPRRAEAPERRSRPPLMPPPTPPPNPVEGEHAPIDSASLQAAFRRLRPGGSTEASPEARPETETEPRLRRRPRRRRTGRRLSDATFGPTPPGRAPRALALGPTPTPATPRRRAGGRSTWRAGHPPVRSQFARR